MNQFSKIVLVGKGNQMFAASQMSNASETMDALAAIAARGASAQAAAVLEEQLPPILPDLRLPALQPGDAHAFLPRPAPTAKLLALELAELRQKMAPFLEDLAPRVPNHRATVSLHEADWRLEPASEWQAISLPHYGGPTGRARAWYRMRVTLDQSFLDAGSQWVCFGGVDYKAAVFLNGDLVGTHEGFFSPFEFEVSRSARLGENDLLVRVDNDGTCMGFRGQNGDKIYAATGLGWDEPGAGWHHCPPGMGIHRPVRFEARPVVHLGSLFVRPLPESESAELWVEIYNQQDSDPVEIEVTIHGQNFPCDPIILEGIPELPPADHGVNRYRISLPMEKARLWSLETPWLYAAHVLLRSGGEEDTASVTFGMRSFLLDETPDAEGRRGRFFLNGQPIRLRGANTMGHEQQCVFRGDLDQLRDDILLAKLTNMNFLRFTQRPVEPEVYDMCDRLGMMAQTDLPLFAHLRRNQFSEAVRQSSEMERLIRAHPSSVLISYINEPFPLAWGDKSHRHLTRKELESFFVAANQAVWVENPDRQIKAIDGDYEPPGPGLPDGHCYAGWYNGHGYDLGKIHRGYWFPIKAGWNYACGEFGAEGLEDEALMRECYPAHWLPSDAADEANWTPKRIHDSQTGGQYHLWMEPGRSMAEWIQRSQAHQKWATEIMTHALRRNNRVVSFAIHLFIDAWPAGWMKTLMDCRRQPKSAYFAYRDALAPLAVNLRLDRTVYFSGESFDAEAWVCNDLPTVPGDFHLAYQLERGDVVLFSEQTVTRLRPCEATFQGRLIVALPEVADRETLTLQLGLVGADGSTVHDHAVKIVVIPRPKFSRLHGHAMGAGKDEQLAVEMEMQKGDDVLIVADPYDLPKVASAVEAGATALLMEFPPGEYEIGNSKVRFEETGMESRHYVARDPQHPVARLFEENDFKFWFDPAADSVSPLLHTLFFADATWTPILHTGQGGWGRGWEPALAAAEKPFGKGRYIICQPTLAGRLINPVARLFLASLLNPERSRISSNQFPLPSWPELLREVKVI